MAAAAATRTSIARTGLPLTCASICSVFFRVLHVVTQPRGVIVLGMQKRLSLATSRPGLRSAIVLAMAAAATLTMSGCATIVNGRQQHVLVTSQPSGADVLLNGESVGTTPATVRMRRRGPAELELRKAGFATEAVSVPRRVSRWVAVNLIYFNPLAAQGMNSVGQWFAWATGWFSAILAVDLLSGGAYVRPPVVNVELSPLEEAPTPAQRCQAAGCRDVGLGLPLLRR